MTDKFMQCPSCDRRWVNDCWKGDLCTHCKNPDGTRLAGREVNLTMVIVDDAEGNRIIEKFQRLKRERIRENVANMARRRNE